MNRLSRSRRTMGSAVLGWASSVNSKISFSLPVRLDMFGAA
jgi:hypothetical protein